MLHAQQQGAARPAGKGRLANSQESFSPLEVRRQLMKWNAQMPGQVKQVSSVTRVCGATGARDMDGITCKEMKTVNPSAANQMALTFLSPFSLSFLPVEEFS